MSWMHITPYTLALAHPIHIQILLKISEHTLEIVQKSEGIFENPDFSSADFWRKKYLIEIF